MRAETFVCFNHFCIPTPACSRSLVHNCCMNEKTKEHPLLTVFLAPSPCNAEVFLSSPGHLTTGTLLSDIQANWHLVWKSRKTCCPQFWELKLTLDLWWHLACLQQPTQPQPQWVGTSSKMLPLASLLLQSGGTSALVGLGVFGADGPLGGLPTATTEQALHYCHNQLPEKGPKTELCFDSGQQ